EELLEALEQAAPVSAMTATATITLRRVLNKRIALDLLRKQPSARSGFRPTIRSRRERNTAAWGGQLVCAWSGPVGQRRHGVRRARCRREQGRAVHAGENNGGRRCPGWTALRSSMVLAGPGRRGRHLATVGGQGKKN